MMRRLFLLTAVLWLWPISEAASQQWPPEELVSGWDALLEQFPFFLIVLLLVAVAWSVVLLVLYTVLPFSVLGLSGKLDQINRSLQALGREIECMAQQKGNADRASYQPSQEERGHMVDR